MNNKELIQKLLEERDALLKQYPALIKCQMELEEKLAQIEEPQERAQLMFKLLLEHLREEFIPAQMELQKLELQVKELKKSA